MTAPELHIAVDPDTEIDDVEIGRKLFAREIGFLKGVVGLDGLPEADRPEICFAGRSNVGKSTLINALTGRKGLARSSNTPGRTQELNFFTIPDAGYVVDLPGYGFAKAPKAKVDAWQALLRAYVAGRTTLARVIVLIDARHGVKDVDHTFMETLDRAAVVFQTVMTKADKPKKSALADSIAQTREALRRHPAAYPMILTTSAETGEGIPELRAHLAPLLT